MALAAAMTPGSLLKIFVLVAAAAATTGCAITPVGTCNKACRLEEAARTMSQSDDVGVRAVGVRTLERLHPELNQEAANVRQQAVPATLECTVSSVEVVDGKKVIKMTGCAKPAAGPKAP